MPITPTSGSITLPPEPEKVIDTYWMQQLIINAPSIDGNVQAQIMLLPYNSTTGETFPDMRVGFFIDDILTTAQSDPTLANTINTIFAEVQRQAQLQGLI